MDPSLSYSGSASILGEVCDFLVTSDAEDGGQWPSWPLGVAMVSWATCSI